VAARFRGVITESTYVSARHRLLTSAHPYLSTLSRGLAAKGRRRVMAPAAQTSRLPEVIVNLRGLEVGIDVPKAVQGVVASANPYAIVFLGGLEAPRGRLKELRLRLASVTSNVSAPSYPLAEETMQLVPGLRALASPTRLRVLELLKNPAAFDGPRGPDGRPLGVTAKALVKQLRCRQPSLSEQMEVLLRIGLVESRKVGRFVVYSRDEERIRQLKQTIIDQLLPPPATGA
jgi:ArsR family transcriptional regulator